jgi:hypothetical protein
VAAKRLFDSLNCSRTNALTHLPALLARYTYPFPSHFLSLAHNFRYFQAKINSSAGFLASAVATLAKEASIAELLMDLNIVYDGMEPPKDVGGER